jgi:hypothetical protein
VIGADSIQAIPKEPDKAIATINKMFEKYLEILKRIG